MAIELSQLTSEQIELLRETVRAEGRLFMFRKIDTKGLAVRTNERKFYDPHDPSVSWQYIDALRGLVVLSLVRQRTREEYELTNHGWEIGRKCRQLHDHGPAPSDAAHGTA